MARTRRRVPAAGAVVALALSLAAAPQASAAPLCSVDSGWDLFETAEGTQFDPLAAALQGLPATIAPDTSLTAISFQGVPLRQYDFGEHGFHDTGSTDTVVRRYNAIGVPPDGSAADNQVFVELTALQLQANGLSATGIRTPLPLYVTLQSQRGMGRLDPPPGPQSFGLLDVRFNSDCFGGSLRSDFTVYFDIRVGAIDGPVVSSGVTDDLVGFTRLPLNAEMPWSPEPALYEDCEQHLRAQLHGIIGPPVLIDQVNVNRPLGDLYVGEPIR